PALVLAQQAGLLGNVGERAVAVVAVEDVLTPIGHEQIVETVVVVVAHAHRGYPARAVETGLFRYVGECAITIVLVQPVGAAVGRAFQSRAAQKENVQPAVVIVVDERHATTHRLDDVLFAVHSAVDHGLAQPGLFRDVNEVRIEGQARGFPSRHGLNATGRNALRPCAQSGGRQKGQVVSTGHSYRVYRAGRGSLQ